MKIKTLDEIAIEYGTDKASKHPSINGHNYCIHYDRYFSPIRASARKVLEIGVGGAESMKMWLDFFPYAAVHGIDIVRDTNDWNTPGAKPDPRYTYSHGNQSDETMWQCFVANHGSDWDVIVDDGGHCNSEIITSFKMMWPHIRPGGMYCIEDLACGYGDGSVHVKPGFKRHMEFISELLDNVNRGELEIDCIYYARELAIVQKRRHDGPVLESTGRA